ncbi:hypothetical protein BGL34_01555 [Fructilactobacillus lindneri]|uniref:DUF2929 domain-containing protein n=2 Tax=Fructilactobacillus lindneri TaxID=53444 RepID=A0A0R2JXN3_9LACO|nr:DUF2929 family protein [Fructilactobacillus lindneri]ANZ58143.1 hypothetical protein AYR60_05030 [Fructilactobacillus lindneri]ANZ59464.1 hypothetical protein AYR59_05285 [Fructilactobacillus lindneri]KRN78964.1 hypothetical protein IV52_GL000368 [Fructilactobacillus lindneri DSM 20690 = JCM 11027]POG98752.1 hypothetical protein BGL31_02145 [Fructilactobacillus lindneri]POH03025.1 hypothetical protein BGL33_03580 [Fructilactobacillus lindneri]
MRIIAANLTTLFWGIVYGEIIGYIGSALVQVPFSKTIAINVAIVGAIIAIFGVNLLKLVMKP